MITEMILLALYASFIILLITKLGWREKVQIYGPKLISDMFNCDFCISFWTCFVLSVLLFTFGDGDWVVLFYPLFASPIVRLLI
jgi:hypothetical protein